MTFTDPDLTHLAAHGTPPLPAGQSAYVAADGAQIWFTALGTGPAVVLLHGGLGHAGNWAYQVPALVAAGYRVIAIDSRGQGRSTRDGRPYSYELMAADNRAVLDALGIPRAAFIGWSDGADTSLVLARETPDRVAGIYFFGCNVDATGTLPFVPTPVVDRIYVHHVREYAALSPIPAGFDSMRDDLGVMQASQPEYDAAVLAGIDVPVWSVIAEHDEFIRREHAEYLAATLPRGSFHLLPGVSHFAPLQNPALFNASMLAFLAAHHRD